MSSDFKHAILITNNSAENTEFQAYTRCKGWPHVLVSHRAAAEVQLLIADLCCVALQSNMRPEQDFIT